VTIDIRRAVDRTRIEQPGIVTWHCFSAGAHYDPNNLSFGALIAHDEHLLARAAGFPQHAHRGVDIVSWVLDGELRHDGQTIGAGSVLHQRTGNGIEHVEANARSDRSLRFVQMSLLSSDVTSARSEQRIDLPRRRKHGMELVLRLPDAALYLARGSPQSPAQLPSTDRAHVFVTRGATTLGPASLPGYRLAAGDAARIVGESDLLLATETAWEALIWTLAS
jgi:redox-sensitive bicupin YhaK (pirin superfamily)